MHDVGSEQSIIGELELMHDVGSEQSTIGERCRTSTLGSDVPIGRIQTGYYVYLARSLTCTPLAIELS